MSISLLVSISESGITYTEAGWLMYVVAVLSVSNYTKNRHQFVEPVEVEESRLIDLDFVDSSPALGDTNLVGPNVR
jgi:hypothetical protein